MSYYLWLGWNWVNSCMSLEAGACMGVLVWIKNLGTENWVWIMYIITPHTNNVSLFSPTESVSSLEKTNSTTSHISLTGISKLQGRSSTWEAFTITLWFQMPSKIEPIFSTFWLYVCVLNGIYNFMHLFILNEWFLLFYIHFLRKSRNILRKSRFH